MTKKEALLAKADEDKKEEAEESGDEEPTPKQEEADVKKQLAQNSQLLERAIALIGKQQKQIDLLKAEYPKKLEGQYMDQESGVEVNPEGKTSLDGDKVHTLNSSDQATKPTKDTMTTQGAFAAPASVFTKADAEAFKASLLKEVATVVKASTPTPTPFREMMRKSSEDTMAYVKEMVYKAIEDNRSRAVFSADAENGSGGHLPLTQEQGEQNYLFVRKMAEA